MEVGLPGAGVLVAPPWVDVPILKPNGVSALQFIISEESDAWFMFESAPVPVVQSMVNDVSPLERALKVNVANKTSVLEVFA